MRFWAFPALRFSAAVVKYQYSIRFKVIIMYLYNICAAMEALEKVPAPGGSTLVLLTSEELKKGVAIPGLEQIIHHTPSAQDARTCKAEFRHDCLCGTIFTPRRTKDGAPIAFGYLLTEKWAVLCDDTGTARSAVQHLQKGNPQRELGVGGFFCEFLEWLIAKDLHHLQKLEDDMDQMEEQILSGELDQFNPRMNTLRKEIIRWLRYYTQLDDMVCEFQENETALFRDSELQMLHMVEKRIGRLDSEAQTLREYSIQLRELFQAEIDIRQNRIMKILTIVTTVFLPLSLVVGWYGMNFINMPELTWRYGYPAIIVISVLIVALCLWIMKKKKFW